MRRIPAEIRAILASKARKVFFVGAGISSDKPTSFPLAQEFSSELISLITEGDAFLIEQAKPILYEIRQGTHGCRLEMLLEIARQGLGDDVLHVLGVLDEGVPNAYHYALAMALRAGHKVVTTNFDNMIERAYSELYPKAPLIVVSSESDCQSAQSYSSSKRILFKIHGSLRNAHGRISYTSIQLTLASLSSGLVPAKRELLRSFFYRRDVIFIGYSGRDDFDLTPFIISFDEARRYLWCKYCSGRLGFQSSSAIARSRKQEDIVDTIIRNKPGSYTAIGDTRNLLPLLPFFNLSEIHGFLTRRSHDTWRGDLENTATGLELTSHNRVRYIAKILQHNSLYTQARECLNRNVRQSRGLQRAVALDDLAQYCFVMRKFDHDLVLRRRARLLARKYRSKKALNLVGRTWLGAAEAYRNTSQFGRALNSFRKAADIYKHLSMPAKVGYSLAGMAAIYRMNSRFPSAEKFSKKAIANMRKGRDHLGALYATWGLAELRKYRGFFERADRAYKAIRNDAEKLGHRNLTGWGFWGRAEILRLSWKIPEAIRMYTKAFEVFADHDLAGRSWSLEGRAQCKIISGVDPLSDIYNARRGFSRLRATIGEMATQIDLAIYYLYCAKASRAQRVLSTIHYEKFPLKDQANFWLVTAELTSMQKIDKALLYYRRAIELYRKLDMAHAALEASILTMLHAPKNTLKLANLSRVARGHNYLFELSVLRRIQSNHRVTRYGLNLY